MNQQETKQISSVVIEPPKGWLRINFKELVEYRDLFWFMMYKAVRGRYAQSALGTAWAIIQPVVTMLVFTVVFGKMVGVESDGAPYALFSFAGLVPWTYFQTSLTEGVQTLIQEQNMISKIYFPRLILPISRILARLLDFSVAMIILFGFLVWYQIVPNMGILMLPILCLMMVAATGGFVLIFSAMAVQYRDINYAMAFIARLLMYAAPVVYPTSLVPDEYRIWYALNPMVGVIEGFRSGLIGTNPMPWDLIIPGAIVSLFLFVGGAMFFRRKERLFADVA